MSETFYQTKIYWICMAPPPVGHFVLGQDSQTEVQWCHTMKVFKKKKTFKNLWLENHRSISILKPHVYFVVSHQISKKKCFLQRNNQRNNRKTKGTTSELPDKQNK